METGLQKYLEQAVNVLERFGVTKKEGEESQVASLLEEVVSVNEPKVLAIAKTLEYAGSFNELVRDNVKEIKLGNRYGNITSMFDSIREDSKNLLKQLEDGKIDTSEKIQNLWMKLARGSPHKRFDKIRKLYLDVSQDTVNQLERENEIINAYVNFRFALKETESIGLDLLKLEESRLNDAKSKYNKNHDEVKNYKGNDSSTLSRLELARDEADHAFKEEDRKYQLIKDIAENLTIGYNVGEILIQKLQQTHQVKDQVYRKSITFFKTNEHVFTFLDAVYTAEHGLHEATQTLESMKTGVDKGLEDIAEMGGKIDKKGIETGYGSTINKESVKKLVDAIVTYQTESRQMIENLRIKSAQNAKDIEMIVNDGKERYRLVTQRYLEQSTVNK